MHRILPLLSLSLALFLFNGESLAAPEGEVAAANQPVAAQEPETPAKEEHALAGRILQLLETAEICLKANRLTIPPGNNAFEMYAQVLELDPENILAKDGLQRIVQRYIALTEHALARNAPDEARALLERAEKILPSQEALPAMRAKVLAAQELEKNAANTAAQAADRAEARPDDPVGVDPVQDAQEDAPVIPDEADHAAEGDHQDLQHQDPVQPEAGDVWIEPATGMEFVWVPAGCFSMGCDKTDLCRDDEIPVHEICLSGFWMGRFEVTQAQWIRLMGQDQSRFKGGRNPVDSVSWHMAGEFVRKMNSLAASSGFGLPTEAQWEFACRGGPGGEGPGEFACGGDGADDAAWHLGNSGGKTHPVGEKAPNALGIYDMSGNVAEWCVDVYDADAYADWNREVDPVMGGEGDRVFRGGSWNVDPPAVRAAARNRNTPGLRYSALGFRLIRQNLSERAGNDLAS